MKSQSLAFPTLKVAFASQIKTRKSDMTKEDWRCGEIVTLAFNPFFHSLSYSACASVCLCVCMFASGCMRISQLRWLVDT